MKPTIQLFMILILAVLLAVTGCQKKEEPAEQQAGMEEQKPSKVLDLSEVTTVMTVREIDLPERLFTLEYGEDNVIVVEAADDLTNLENIKIGDEVEVTYLKSTAVYVTSPDSGRPPMAKSTNVEVGTKDGKPRKITVDIIEETQTVEAIDYENRVVSLKDAEGNMQTIEVADDLQNFENVKVGDQVITQYTEAVAVDIRKVEE